MGRCGAQAFDSRCAWGRLNDARAGDLLQVLFEAIDLAVLGFEIAAGFFEQVFEGTHLLRQAHRALGATAEVLFAFVLERIDLVAPFTLDGFEFRESRSRRRSRRIPRRLRDPRPRVSERASAKLYSQAGNSPLRTRHPVGPMV